MTKEQPTKPSNQQTDRRTCGALPIKFMYAFMFESCFYISLPFYYLSLSLSLSLPIYPSISFFHYFYPSIYIYK